MKKKIQSTFNASAKRISVAKVARKNIREAERNSENEMREKVAKNEVIRYQYSDLVRVSQLHPIMREFAGSWISKG